MNDPVVLSAEQLHKDFGEGEVLCGVSMQVRKGELVSIIGPSGCGKSTFLRCLNFLEIPDRGTVTAMGVTIARMVARGGARMSIWPIGCGPMWAWCSRVLICFRT